MKRRMYQRLLPLAFLAPAISIAQTRLALNDLSAFTVTAKNWKVAGTANADLNKVNKLVTTPGTGILVNVIPDKRSDDLFTKEEYGDMDLELDYMMAVGANSGIYLQSRYEFQLADNWSDASPSQHSNGAIYQRWHNDAPDGQQGYDGHAPRMNASRAPGTWQHLKISFRAPRFDASGNKIANAFIRSAELNGVLIHENVELSGPTRGSVDNKEVAKAPLRFQGDHGTVAFRNITISSGNDAVEKPNGNDSPDPILLNATSPLVHRSFMDIPYVGRLTHAISVGTPDKINFTYDPLTGFIAQAWRGEFLDATPMWHDRGDGSSKPRGAVIYFGKPAPAIAVLADKNAAWPTDTVNTGFRPKGYSLNQNDMPVFKYMTTNMKVTDDISVAEKAHGFTREIVVDNILPGTYFLLATAQQIQKLNEQQYIIGDGAYYLHLDKASGNPLLREGADGMKELIIPIRNKIVYTILF